MRHRVAVDRRPGFSAACLRPASATAPEVLARRAELVHVAHGVAGDPVGGRHRAVRDQVRAEAARCRASRRRCRAGRYPPRPSPRSPCGRRARGARARPPTASAAAITGPICPGISGPAWCQLTDRPSASCTSSMPGPGEARRRRAHGARVRRDAVDVVGREASVGDRAQRRLGGQVHVGAEEPPADLRLPDAGQDGAALEPLLRRTRRGGRDSTSAVSVCFGGASGVVRSVAGGARGGVGLEDRAATTSSVTFRNVTFTGIPTRRRRARSRRCWS